MRRTNSKCHHYCQEKEYANSAITNRSDWGLATFFAINAVCCVAILMRIGSGAATPSGCATRTGQTFAWQHKDGCRGRS